MPRNAPAIISQPGTEAQAPPVEVKSPTVIRRNLRDAVEDVFWELGGPEGMMNWTKESTANKRIFYKDILPKLIPKQLTGEITGANGGPMKLVVEWQGETPSTAPASAILQAVTEVVSESVDLD